MNESIFRPMYLKGMQDSVGFWIQCYRFQIPGTGFRTLSVEFGFRIPIVNGIPDSGFRELYSGFQRPRYLIPQTKISQIPDSTRKNFSDSGFHKQKFHGLRNLESLTWPGCRQYERNYAFNSELSLGRELTIFYFLFLLFFLFFLSVILYFFLLCLRSVDWYFNWSVSSGRNAS